MNWQAVAFDWNQARAFLATAEEGSFSAAARALGLTQPTLGRQVAALEAELGVTLFERAGRSLSLTRSGIDLLEHFRAMGEAADDRIGVSGIMLRKALHERGLLLGVETADGKTHLAVRRTIGGRRRRVLHVPNLLIPPDEGE